MTSVKCPGCGEQNTSEMAFCIYCGTPFKAPVEAKASISAVRGRTCVSCGQTDMLNSQFCIFCGAPVEGSVPVSGHNGSGAERAVGPSRQGTHEQRATSARNMGIAAAIVAGISGATLGVVMSWLGAQGAPQQPLQQLPKQGMAILTTQPHSAIQIDSHDRRSFVAARSGVNGDISLPNVNPGQYHVTITGPDGQTVQKDVTVPDEHALIIGGPPGGEIFAKLQ